MPRGHIPVDEAATKLGEPVQWLLELAADELSSVRLWTLATRWPCTWFGTFESQGRLVRSRAVDDQGEFYAAADVEFPDVVNRWVALDEAAITQIHRDGVATVGRVWQRGYEAVLEPPVELQLAQVYLRSVDLTRLLPEEPLPEEPLPEEPLPEEPLSEGGRRTLQTTIGLLTLALVHERERRIKIGGGRHSAVEEFGTFENPNISALARHLRLMVIDEDGAAAHGFASSTLRGRLERALGALKESSWPLQPEQSE